MMPGDLSKIARIMESNMTKAWIERRMDADRKKQDRIKELEAQVGRLQQTLIDLVDNYTEISSRLEWAGDDRVRLEIQTWLRDNLYLGEWGDLDPIE